MCRMAASSSVQPPQLGIRNVDAAVECPACQANLLHPVAGDGPSGFRRLDLEGLSGTRVGWSAVCRFWTALCANDSMWSAGEREEALRAISYTGFVQRGCSADEQVETDDRPDISTFTPDSSSRNRKKAYRVDFSYYGGDFDSFAWIPDGTSVLGLIHDAYKKFRPPGANTPMLAIAGRTDRGVNAIQQTMTFTTKTELDEDNLKTALQAAHQSLRIQSVRRCQVQLHATFSAKSREYIYLLPPSLLWVRDCNASYDEKLYLAASEEAREIDRCIQHLESPDGADFWSFARATPASKSSICQLYRARAWAVEFPKCISDKLSQVFLPPAIICISLKSNRFIRRLCRVIVATAVRESSFMNGKIPKCFHEQHRLNVAAEAAVLEARRNASSSTVSSGDERQYEILKKFINLKSRQATAPPAPPWGLSLVKAGYDQ